MTANELRIGNWAMLKQMPIIIKEIGCLIDLDSNKEGYLINENWIDEFEPIPLTPEILRKCGILFYRAGEIRIKYRTRGFFTFRRDGEHKWRGMGKIYGINILYLHQLQNLYFALTGEELQIEL